MQEPLAGAAKRAFGNQLWSALAQPERKVSVENLVLAALQARDPEGHPFATPEDLAQPVDFVMLHEVVAPLLRQFLPEGGVGGAADALAGAAGADAQRVDALEAQVAELRSALDKQDRVINELRKRKR